MTVFDQVLVLRMVLMSLCRLDINKSKSDLGVRSLLRIMLMSVCSRSDINISKSDLSVRSDIIVSVR